MNEEYFHLIHLLKCNLKGYTPANKARPEQPSITGPLRTCTQQPAHASPGGPPVRSYFHSKTSIK